ncbi:MAG: Gfo/Idh/MocA family oxidoreductase [Chloroflexota bacterium]|nr:Gfo/Idh/MocA family oxidoreductase [Chloroflexota bacterium]
MELQEVRAVLAGCGSISRVWLEAATQMDGVHLVGLVDLVPGAAERRAEEFGLSGATTGTDLEQALVRTQPDIVFNCTPPEAHLPTALLALDAGCHVLGEKPMADSMEAARSMLAAKRRSGRLCAVIQNRRYDPEIRRLRRLLDSGRLGEITTAHSDFFIGAHFGGFRDSMPHVLLLDMAIHTFDAARFIMRADPVSVYCMEWNPVGSWYERDASAVAVFEMTGGRVYTYRGSWAAEGLHTSWEADWRLIGSNGSVRWDGGEGFAVQTVVSTGGFHSELRDEPMPDPSPTDKHGGHAGVIREFIECVRSGQEPETSVEDNIRSLAMVFGAIESAAAGKEVGVRW